MRLSQFILVIHLKNLSKKKWAPLKMATLHSKVREKKKGAAAADWTGRVGGLEGGMGRDAGLGSG